MQGYPYRIVNPGQRQGVIFLHGFLGDKDEFKHIGRELEKSHTVVYVDLPGHGENLMASRECPSFHDVAAGIARTIQAHSSVFSKSGKTSWHVVGYSLGGRLALYIACHWPELVNRLTLISASPGLTSPRDRQARIASDRLLARKLHHTSMREFLSYWYRQPLFGSVMNHPRFYPNLRRRLNNSPKQMALALIAMSLGTQPHLWDELHKLKMPIEVICGALDEKFCAIGRSMVARNPQIRLTVVAQAGHVVHWESAHVLKARVCNVENRMEERKAF